MIISCTHFVLLMRKMKPREQKLSHAPQAAGLGAHWPTAGLLPALPQFYSQTNVEEMGFFFAFGKKVSKNLKLYIKILRQTAYWENIQTL